MTRRTADIASYLIGIRAKPVLPDRSRNSAVAIACELERRLAGSGTSIVAESATWESAHSGLKDTRTGCAESTGATCPLNSFSLLIRPVRRLARRLQR
jgi:hypothetical protein